MTARRDTIRQALADAGTFVSAQDLHAQLRAAGHGIGLTTVYRALAAMTDRGEADVLTAEGQQAYRACSGGKHHHHLVCRSCGKTVEVSGPAVERWAETIGGEHGFTDITHTVEVFGTCTDCARRPASTSATHAVTDG
ncbi:MAG: transcriptional repressor [Actinobacteria bacterium]|nr:transcriptional repressor [Actinomycetota bacterium]MBO0784791.1 transcriptional repressor [Actinomycetota bacterium]